MLLDVLEAIGKSGVVEDCLVISSDKRVLEEAKRMGFSGLMEGRPEGLNGALKYATDWCTGRGAKALLILPGDLPLLTGEDVERLFSYLKGERGVVVSPCRRREGTNALLRIPPDVMPTLFGTGSYEAHLRGARALGIPVRVDLSEGISFDVDTVEDLRDLLTKNNRCQAHTRSFLDGISRLRVLESHRNPSP